MHCPKCGTPMGVASMLEVVPGTYSANLYCPPCAGGKYSVKLQTDIVLTASGVTEVQQPAVSFPASLA